MEIEIIIRDEPGHSIDHQTPKRYELGTELSSLTKIEGAVELYLEIWVTDQPVGHLYH